MSITLKSLMFILPIGFISFWFASKFINSNLISRKEFATWRNIWLSLQIIAFTSPNIWVFYSGLFILCIFFLPKMLEDRVVIYCLVLSSLPLLTINLPGFGILNYLFTFNFARALSLFILLPAFFVLKQRNTKQLKLFSQPADIFIITFLLLISILDFRDDTFFNGLRFSFLHFIDYFLPYYVISRSITNINYLNKILLALLLSISISTAIGLFEAIKHWHIYNHLSQHLIGTSVTSGEVRAGVLRASATFMTPIALGLVITIGFGFYLYLSPLFRNTYLKKLLPLFLILGLWVTVSRGPWVGFAFLCLIYIWLGKDKIKYYSWLLTSIIASLPVLLMTTFGRTFIDTLPFIGTIRSETVEYRERLGEMAFIVIQRHPLFGSTSFLDTPEMISMQQSKGGVDMVNNYIQIALSSGFTGLILFSSIFITLLWHIYKLINHLPKVETDKIRLGRVLFSTLAAVALIIYTVSSVDYIPYYYWILFALSTSYIYICKQNWKNS